MLPKTHKEAISLGSPRYFTGKPCKFGHVSERFTKSGCVECSSIRLRAKRQEYPELYSEYERRKREKQDKEVVAAYQKKWKQLNREYINDQLRKRRATPRGKANTFIRRCLQRCLNDNERIEHLGYDQNTLVAHIEKQFVEGMTWDNHGDWHIDHIKTINSFLNEGINDPSIVNALSNLRPLWAADNLSRPKA